MKSPVAKLNVVKCGRSQTKNVNIETLFCWEIQSVNKSQSFKGIISTWYIAPSLHCTVLVVSQSTLTKMVAEKSRFNWESWVVWLSADILVSTVKNFMTADEINQIFFKKPRKVFCDFTFHSEPIWSKFR